MDLASVVAALASVGVRVSGSTPNSSVQGDSSRACPTGLAGPEPSGTINDPGQHFHSSPHVAPNIVPKGASFPFPFLAALLQALTFAFATSIPGVGEVSNRGTEDTTEAKPAATGSLPSRRLRFARVKPGASALALGRAPSVYISFDFFRPSCYCKFS